LGQASSHHQNWNWSSLFFQILTHSDTFQLSSLTSFSLGKDLLISGLWAYSRKPNYFGDLIQAWCFGFASFSGFSSFIPYLNAIFLTLLLIQRERRDNDWYNIFQFLLIQSLILNPNQQRRIIHMKKE
jgi:hypothetical protein